MARRSFLLAQGIGPVARSFAAIVLAGLAANTPLRSAAADLVSADPWQIIHVAREFGTAEVTRDAMKDPSITVGGENLDYDIVFYGCRLGRDCSTILFRTRLELTDREAEPPAGQIADWNREKLFGRAYLDDKNRAVLDHPVIIGAGVPADTLRATFQQWQTALKEYSRHLDY